ncbi:hypothetical protein BP00DRAFT_426309 [Aspergillus indologenus CBS 114.80]|uniref:Uncharacterized protein n=1 Tax=Aspergillus indologenus CBS 114.80 TaxID=1450541 RepID=A0A2V5I3D1_9EURO|nr:hypothetical protein BP00DRAFT_426309 [Aspergillus indologenus CBS 114.80]
MSLNTATGVATSGLQGRPPKLTGDVKSTVQQGHKTVNKTAQNTTDSVLPGQFPGDEDGVKSAQRDQNNDGPILSPMREWYRRWVPRMFDKMESYLMGWLSWLLPGPRQARLYDAASKRPASTTFLICQLLCCGVPLLVFLAGVFLFAAVAIILWCVLSLLILGPVLLVASMMGVSMWGWGWFFYSVIKWVDQTYLGGMLSRFWMSRSSSDDDDDENSSKEEGKEKGGEQKEG